MGQLKGAVVWTLVAVGLVAAAFVGWWFGSNESDVTQDPAHQTTPINNPASR